MLGNLAPPQAFEKMQREEELKVALTKIGASTEGLKGFISVIDAGEKSSPILAVMVLEDAGVLDFGAHDPNKVLHAIKIAPANPADVDDLRNLAGQALLGLALHRTSPAFVPLEDSILKYATSALPEIDHGIRSATLLTAVVERGSDRAKLWALLALIGINQNVQACMWPDHSVDKEWLVLADRLIAAANPFIARADFSCNTGFIDLFRRMGHPGAALAPAFRTACRGPRGSAEVAHLIDALAAQ
jgi:hypothetical protein